MKYFFSLPKHYSSEAFLDHFQLSIMKNHDAYNYMLIMKMIKFIVLSKVNNIYSGNLDSHWN